MFLEPGARDGSWREIADPARRAELRRLADNEAAAFALELYGIAWRIAPPSGLARPTLFIAVKPGGNHARVGLTVEEPSGPRELPALPYLELEADADSFATTLLHESGHALHALLAQGGVDAPDAETVAPIPHSTAAVTDRRTAFNEGFAIHLETVAAHCATSAALRGRYRLAPFEHPAGGVHAEAYAPLRDLMTYAQNRARYTHVRDGLYAFEPAIGGDYLRVQLEPARDLRALRDGGALLASEGFVASVLFHLVAAVPCGERAARYRPLLAALRAAERGAGPLDAAPLVDLLAALRAADPALGGEAMRLFLELSRGATVDPEARARWAELFDASLALDGARRKALIAALDARRVEQQRAAEADPGFLVRLAGPVIVVELPEPKVGVAAFGEPRPLAFDVNAAGVAMWQLVPGVTRDAAEAIVAERWRAPFASRDDLAARVGRLLPAGVRLSAPASTSP